MADARKLTPTPEGLLIDLDGTVYEAGQVVPGAPEAIAALRDRGLPIRFLTNTTRMARQGLVDQLTALGVSVGPDDIFTAPLAAAAWLRAQGVQRAALCLPAHTAGDFEGLAITDTDPEVVVVGDLGPEWTFARLNQAFRWLRGGARLLALHRNRFWKTADGVTIDAGAYVAALEYAAGVEATLVGKPSRPMFLAAAASMGVPVERVLVVGDDSASDVAGARRVGARGVLVRTGKGRTAGADAGADRVLDSLADLPDLV